MKPPLRTIGAQGKHQGRNGSPRPEPLHLPERAVERRAQPPRVAGARHRLV